MHEHPQWTSSDVHNPIRDFLVASKVELLQNYDVAALRMRIARRAGVPYSEVLERWTDEDLAMEQAHDIVQWINDAGRCPRCKVDPADVTDDRGRELEYGTVQIYVGDCVVCGEVHKIEAGFDEDARRVGRYVDLRPRPAGAPFVDQ